MNAIVQRLGAILSLILIGCSENGGAVSEAEFKMSTEAYSGSGAGPTAEIAAIERDVGDQLVRVIVNVSAGPGQTGDSMAQVTDALRAAGAVSVEPIAGSDMLVVEATPAQLRSAASTGLILSVQLDFASPTN